MQSAERLPFLRKKMTLPVYHWTFIFAGLLLLLPLSSTASCHCDKKADPCHICDCVPADLGFAISCRDRLDGAGNSQVKNVYDSGCSLHDHIHKSGSKFYSLAPGCDSTGTKISDVDAWCG